MKHRIPLPFLLLPLLFMICCSEDGNFTPTQQQILNLTSNGNSKAWKIATARLIDEAGGRDIDISEGFNVADDEFVFSYAGEGLGYDLTMEWRPRMRINVQASSAAEALSESYGNPLTYNLVVRDANNGEVVGQNEEGVALGVTSNSQVSATLALTDDVKLVVDLVPKGGQDYKHAPASLTFIEVAQISGIGMTTAPGFTGSRLLNALYFAHRAPNQAAGVFEENVLRYDIVGRRVERIAHAGSDFVTKQLHIVDNTLKVVAGSYLNTYATDLQTEPQVVLHGASLSRFGSAQLGNEIYIVGGDLNAIDSDKIKKWNPTNQRFETIAIMPSPKHWADAEIVDGKMYIFGGQEELFNGIPNNLVYIYDFKQETFETLTLPVSVFRTYSARHENLIFIGGQVADTDRNTTDLDIFLAALDTRDNSIRTIETSLSDEGWFTIHQLAVVEDKLYVVYGDAVNSDDGVQDLSILSADL